MFIDPVWIECPQLKDEFLFEIVATFCALQICQVVVGVVRHATGLDASVSFFSTSCRCL